MAGADGSDVAAVLSSSVAAASSAVNDAVPSDDPAVEVAAASSAVKDARAAPSNDPAVEASSEPASMGVPKKRRKNV